MASYRRSDVMEKRPGPAQRVPNITLAGDAKGQYANWYNPKTGKVETQRIADVKPVAPRASGGGRTGTGTTPEERQRVREEAARNTLQSLIDAEQRKEDDLWKQVAFDEGVLESGQAKGPQETFHRSRVKSNREAIQKIQQRKAALIGRKDGAAAGAAARRQLGLSDSTAPGAAPPPAAKAPAKVAPKVTPKKGERRTYQGHEYEFDGREWKLRKAV
jgi:hypothetical protein